MLCLTIHKSKKVTSMESYVVRIYRRYAAEPERIVGLVEHPEQGTVERFNGATDLVRILLEPAPAIGAVKGLEEESRESVRG